MTCRDNCIAIVRTGGAGIAPIRAEPDIHCLFPENRRVFRQIEAEILIAWTLP